MLQAGDSSPRASRVLLRVSLFHLVVSVTGRAAVSSAADVNVMQVNALF